MATDHSHQPCDLCGFDAGALADRELPMALRALGDRWVVFVSSAHDELGADDAVHLRPAAGGWSADEHAVWLDDAAARCLAAAEAALGRPEPAVHAAPIDLDEAVGNLGTEMEDLYELLAHAAHGWWAQPAQWEGRTVTVGDVVRITLHDGYHHLTQAEQALRAVLDA